MNAIQPEDILPDGNDTAEINGLVVRKGTVAATLANIEVIEDSASDHATKTEALNIIKILTPSLKAIGLLKHMQFRNPEIERLFK